MAPHRWIVRTEVTGKTRAVEVVLYETVSAMRQAASKHAKWTGEVGGFSEAAGVCHGFQRGSVDADGNWVDDETVSIIRLSRPYLTPLVISHEVAHAAQHIYGLDYDDGKPMIDHFTSDNEDFAHLYGELFGAIWPFLESAVLREGA